MLQKVQEFARDDSGLTLVEYGLVVTVVSLIGFPAWVFFGDTLSAWFSNIDSDLVQALGTL